MSDGKYQLSVDKDGKADSYWITGSYRGYLAKGMAKKILEKINNEQAIKSAKSKMEQSEAYLIEYFKSISPEGTTLSTISKYIPPSPYNRKDRGYDIKLIEIKYPNKNWVQIRYHDDNKWNIYAKYEYIERTKEEWIDYLSK